MAKSKQKKGSEGGWRRNVLAIGIAIIFVMFIGYAINTFYPEPEYNDYCGEFTTQEFIETQNRCIEAGGEWYPNTGARVPKIVNDSEVVITGYCSISHPCEGEYRDKQGNYNRNIFFISLIIGLITIVGAIFLAVESVSAGLMGGGILLILYGTLRYWGDLSDVWRTIMLGFALGVLIYIGYKKLK